MNILIYIRTRAATRDYFHHCLVIISSDLIILLFFLFDLKMLTNCQNAQGIKLIIKCLVLLDQQFTIADEETGKKYSPLRGWHEFILPFYLKKRQRIP